jgi:hypothetical protein
MVLMVFLLGIIIILIGVALWMMSNNPGPKDVEGKINKKREQGIEIDPLGIRDENS